ncbi:helix-turn-helix domain-containing protein [Actinomyces urogenitalis]|uniref:helix-turn-helix domain-containing protein n=1 Tax=Actinomyces urogenitalis TaxID=103621 RepID=UPI00389A83C4
MQHQLTEAMGVSRATVSNYETGFSSKPRKIVLNAWAMATGVPIQWIETGTVPGSGDDGSPDHEAGASEKLLRLDSNQQPSD